MITITIEKLPELVIVDGMVYEQGEYVYKWSIFGITLYSRKEMITITTPKTIVDTSQNVSKNKNIGFKGLKKDKDE